MEPMPEDTLETVDIGVLVEEGGSGSVESWEGVFSSSGFVVDVIIEEEDVGEAKEEGVEVGDAEGGSEKIVEQEFDS